MQPGAAAPAAVAVFIAGVAPRASGRRVLPLVLLRPGVATRRRVGHLLLEAGPRPVHVEFQLAVPRDERVSVAVVVPEEGVEVVAAVVLGAAASFDQRVDHDDQEDQDARGEHAGARDARLHLEDEEHEDGHGCGRGGGEETEASETQSQNDRQTTSICREPINFKPKLFLICVWICVTFLFIFTCSTFQILQEK